MAKKKAKAIPVGTTVYKLKIALKGFTPTIYRKLEVLDCSLGELYPVLLAAMGWGGYHLHCFRIGRDTYGPPDPELEMEDERGMQLSDLVEQNVKKFVFEYDFGDGWEHDVTIYKPGASKEGDQFPRVTAGAMACPPEDCGGVWGYSELLEILSNPDDPEYEERLEWAGEIDPEEFDLAEVNARLRS